MVRNIACLTASFAVVCGALAGSAWAQTGGQAAFGIEVLSSRPDLVTGGDALVRISGAEAAPKVTVGTARCIWRVPVRRQGRLGRPGRRTEGWRQPAGRQGRGQGSHRHPRQSSLERHPVRGPAAGAIRLRERVARPGVAQRRLMCGADGGQVFLSRQGRRMETVRPQGRASRRHRNHQDHGRQGGPAHRPPGEGRHQPLRLSHQHPARSRRRPAADGIRRLASDRDGTAS